MSDHYSEYPDRLILQQEAIAHIEVQRLIDHGEGHRIPKYIAGRKAGLLPSYEPVRIPLKAQHR